MKKIIIIIILLSSLIMTSCEYRLDVNPTDAVSGSSMFDNTNNAIIALNGIYRFMFEFGLTTEGNYHQCFGPLSYTLMAEIMGEDLIMAAQGSGWFWYDYTYAVKSRYTLSTWRSYDIWNFYYKVIASVNYIIAAKETMAGTTSEVNYIVGQAYALRAYSYHNLAVMFSRTYKGHESEKCVPIYTEPTSSTTVGNPRSTVAEVYTLVRADIDTAVNRLTASHIQNHKSHIDYRIANAFKADICLVTNEWSEAASAAQKAQEGFSIGEAADVVADGGAKSSFNDVTKKNVMWGAEIILDQTTTNPQFMSHMDADMGSYGARSSAAKTGSIWLYNRLGNNDIRKAWWLPNDEVPYIQAKFRFYDYENWIADRIYMRVEEMVLIEAEALCRAGNESDAIVALMKLMAKRDPDYSTSKTGTALGTLTSDMTGSLLEEITIQRRIELWGEHGRIYDIKRYKQGFVRTAAMGHPALGISALNPLKTYNPETYDWVLTIPQSEINANDNISSNDQNPIDSGI
jgi:hypothetical protein